MPAAMTPSLRKYQGLWDTIRKSDSPVEIRSRPAMHARIIQAVKKEKCRSNVARKKLDLPAYGELVIEKIGDVVRFSLRYNGDSI